MENIILKPEPKVRVLYFHLPNKVGLTIATKPRGEEGEEIVQVGFALTHPKDRGTRAEGREVAVRRLSGLYGDSWLLEKKELLDLIDILRDQEARVFSWVIDDLEGLFGPAAVKVIREKCVQATRKLYQQVASDPLGALLDPRELVSL